MSNLRSIPDPPDHAGLDLLEAAVGSDLGTSGWLEIGQETIDRFAEATGDRQWIHVDRERASASPFGGTIAHGYLVLSLAPVLLQEVLDLTRYAMAVNYGIDHLRFIAPVRSGGRLRLRARVLDLERTGHVGLLRLELTFEIEGEAKPACVASVVYRLQEHAA